MFRKVGLVKSKPKRANPAAAGNAQASAASDDDDEPTGPQMQRRGGELDHDFVQSLTSAARA